jgi:hypothetical protein
MVPFYTHAFGMTADEYKQLLVDYREELKEGERYLTSYRIVVKRI